MTQYKQSLYPGSVKTIKLKELPASLSRSDSMEERNYFATYICFFSVAGGNLFRVHTAFWMSSQPTLLFFENSVNVTIRLDHQQSCLYHMIPPQPKLAAWLKLRQQGFPEPMAWNEETLISGPENMQTWESQKHREKESPETAMAYFKDEGVREIEGATAWLICCSGLIPIFRNSCGHSYLWFPQTIFLCLWLIPHFCLY